MMRACACMRARGRGVLLSAALAIAFLAYMAPAGVMATVAWSDESVEQPASEMIDDERDEDSGANEDNTGDDCASAHWSPVSADLSEAGELNDEERGIIDGLVSLRVRLDEALDELATDAVAFDTARSTMAKGAFACDFVSDTRDDTQKRFDEIERAKRDALVLVKTIQDELMQSGDYGAFAIVTGSSTPTDVELRQEMLERLMIAESSQVRKLLGDQRRLRVAIALDEVSSSHARRELRASARPVNDAAYEVEKSCSKVRQCTRDVQLAAEGMQDGDAVLAETRADMLAATEAALSIVKDTERAIGSWYDELDARAGVSDAISFGEGMNFAIREEEFVETWGRAIDEYFESCAKTTGSMPLQGYGRMMAASAYQHKIDPRLCAAVSMAESSGGQNCIRPCNAWGWGAADSDPYGLAAEWDSFEEAIEAWHEGMASSTSGLATAASVSALGTVYCSSPSWGATVVEQMELISKLV